MKNHTLRDSFRHAFDGIKLLVKKERNMRIHLCMCVLVIMCAVIFSLTALEKAVVILLCALVTSAELINTAIENVIDMNTAVFNMYAKRAKDLAAAAVLVLSIASAIIGLIIFVPYGIEFLKYLIEAVGRN